VDPFQQAEFERAMKALEEQEEGALQAIEAGAKWAKAYYNALVGKNFTQDQAISIICAHGVFPKFNN
jgi:hypothetical protein